MTGLIGRNAFLLAFCVLISMGIGLFSACSPEQNAETTTVDELTQHSSNVDPQLVSGFTGGQVGANTPIVCTFVNEVASKDSIGKPLAAGAFTIEPALNGEAVWTSRSTIEFKPKQDFERQKKYTVTISPKALNILAVQGFKDFFFTFSIKPKYFTYRAEGFTSPDSKDLKKLDFTGRLEFLDLATEAEIEAAVKAELDGKALTLVWNHSNKLQPSFTIQGLIKGDSHKYIQLSFQGPYVHPKQSKTSSEYIPAYESFKFKDMAFFETPDRCIKINFTHPLMPNQDLRGLVTTKPALETRMDINGSVLHLYLIDGGSGTIEISLDKAIKNSIGERLGTTVLESVTLEPVLPQVAFLGQGVIVPRRDGVKIPIETVNLNAVIVTIERIYADRVSQFLQVNELDGSKELTRVGTEVWKKIVPISYSAKDQNRKIRSTLDLSPMVNEQDHNLYRITLAFDVRHIEYPGDRPNQEQLLAFQLQNIPIAFPSAQMRVLPADFWLKYENQNDNGEHDYDDWYANRQNPWHPAYYQSQYYYYDYYDESESQSRNLKTSVSRNLVVSDLGLIAQVDDSQRYSIAVTSLLSAAPVGDADIRIYNFQLQEIAQGRSNADGLASISVNKGEAFLIVVEAGQQKGYLKLSGSNNLPVSHFDVSGQEIRKGIKGYIYGERGVWRPGNAIYLTFVLWDKYKTLPANHPVSLTFSDPQGKVVRTIRDVKPVGNFYHFTLETNPSAITGNYLAKVQVGGVGFSLAVPVEAIKPNRLKIALDLPKGLTEIGNEPIKADMQVNWLHGAPGSELEVVVKAFLKPGSTTFKGYEDYQFVDNLRSFRSEEMDVFTGNLSPEGAASIPFDFSSATLSPGKLTATIRTRAYEPGGDYSSDIFAIPFSPYTSYAGIQIPGLQYEYDYLDSEKSNPVKIALVDTNGKGLNGTVKVEVYRVKWSWWWDSYNGDGADYLAQVTNTLVLAEDVAVKNGKAIWNMKLKNEDYGRYYVRVNTGDGHYTGRLFYAWRPWWDYRQLGDTGKSVDMLTLKSSKTSYAVGENVEVRLPSAENSRIYVSMENAGRIISSKWYLGKAGETVLQIPVTAEMTPNVYLHVSLIQPHGQTVNDRPIRMFGILPIMVENPQSRLNPQLQCNDTFEPNSSVEVAVKEGSDKAMTYTIAMVDEGLLGLTRFKSPNAWNSFFQRDASVVQTFDVYGMVAGALNASLERLLAIGGSEEGDGGDGEKANRFPPVVRYLGPFQLAGGQTAKHTIEIPQYVGAVRLMVVAGNDTAFGSTEKIVPVKKPLMVYATLPRTISVTEKFAMPLTVFALEPKIKDVNITVKVSEQLRINGASSKKIQFKAVGEELINFSLEALTSAGVAKVEIIAQGGGQEARQTIELDVRVPTVPRSEVTSISLEPGKSWTGKQAVFGLPGTNSITLEAGLFQDLGMDKHLRYLIQYPYGCVEQTTSSAFPQLYLDKVLNLDAEALAKVRSNVQGGINRLTLFMTANGGLAYWPGSASADAYGSTYAAHFIFMAGKQGYYVPDNLQKDLITYLKLIAQNQSRDSTNYRGDNQFYAAYALFDLALAGSPELGAMNRLSEQTDLSPTARFKLAASYALIGNIAMAEKLLGTSIPSIRSYMEMDGSYGSDVRDLAILAEGLMLGGRTDKALPLLMQIGKSLKNRNYSTQTLAYSLVVVGEYLSRYTKEQEINLDYEIDGQKGNITSTKPLSKLNFDLAKTSLGQRTVVLKNNSKAPIFLNLILSGQPSLQNDSKPQQKGIRLDVSYADADGNNLDLTKVSQGTDIVVTVNVSNDAGLGLANVALDYLVPSGWEITNGRFEGTEDSDRVTYDYQDIRDDRIYTFFNLPSNRTVSLRFMLHATYQGTFYMPSPKVTAMYDDAIFAIGQSSWVTVNAATE